MGFGLLINREHQQKRPIGKQKLGRIAQIWYLRAGFKLLFNRSQTSFSPVVSERFFCYTAAR